jgi:hypothetical protein
VTDPDAILDELLELAPPETPTQQFAQAKPGGERTLGMLLKRTYAIRPDGDCEPVDDEQQEPICDGEIPYGDVEAPLVSAVLQGDDTLAFKEETDLVVQGSAYAYREGVRQTTAGVRFGDLEREIVVFGDRIGEWHPVGGPRFSDPEPFEKIPVVYDLAYGGLDITASARYGHPAAVAMSSVRPDTMLDVNSPYHYPRNPAGTGFLISLDRDSFADLAVPNFEYAFDPLTPERLAVGEPKRWINAPLPAGMDWQSAAWFPRTGYLGFTRTHELLDAQVAEVALGWAADNLLDIPSMLTTLDRMPRLEFAQSASPGMTVRELPRDAELEFWNMHPDSPLRRVRLPDEVPRVKVALNAGKMVELDTQLNTIVVRTDHDRLVVVWCARTPVDRAYTPKQLANMRQDVQWRRW